MKIIEWLREQWNRLKKEDLIPEPPEGVIEGILGVDYVVREGIVFYSREKGEEQIKVNNETFEREINIRLHQLEYDSKLMCERQLNIYEELKRLDEKLTEVIKMLMDVKDKL